MPKGIWVKQSLGGGGTCQPHPQMVMMYMCTDGNLRCWQSLTTPLNPAFINPFDAPHIQVKGCHMGGDGYLQSLETAKEGASCTNPLPSVTGVEGLGSTPLDSWGGRLNMVVIGAWWHLLGRGGAEDMEECDIAPLRSLYKPSATASSTFCNPSASNHCASLLNKLAHLSKCSPWKREKRVCHKAQA